MLVLSGMILLIGCGVQDAPQQDSTFMKEQTENNNVPDELVCTFTVDCSTVFSDGGKVEPGILDLLPSDGAVLSKQAVAFSDGESVYDVLKRICQTNSIPLEVSVTPGSGSVYVESIANLREFDGGAASGWLYRVNGEECGFGSNEYILSPGDIVEWRYSCDFGEDVVWDNENTR